MFDTLIEARDLAELIAQRRDLVLLDCRASLADPNGGHEAYLGGHIDGALHANLETQLSDPDPLVRARHGRHPLPDRPVWRQQLGDWGITPAHQVVVYDDAGGAYAARAWWMLRWAGHPNVALLDGGLAAWSQPLTTTVPDPVAQTAYPECEPLCHTVDTNAVGDAVRPGTLVDARARARYEGKMEPIDAKAGHIPGAVCFDFAQNLDEHGRFLTPVALTERFAGVTDPIICYCGSGVTACHNILALTIIGRQDVRLYVDSFSGWICDPERDIAQLP